MTRRIMPDNFREALGSRRRLVATFVKTPSHAQAEVLGLSGLDFVCFDAEHAPWNRESLDACLLASRAMRLPALVRVPELNDAAILQALDSGATGVVVPHLCTGDGARRLARAAHYGPGGRGYAGSTRAADYNGKPMHDHLREQRAQTAVIAQLEDAEALDHLDEIMAVEDIDAFLIGRVDLTVALGADSTSDPRVEEAVERICAAAKRHGRALGMFLPNLEEAPRWLEAGMSFFLIGSDQSFVFHAAQALQQDFEAL
ncbi:HpcH/HpaI aldolase family protein [Halomonas borealis]|uniref:HpcH/HpaI aldolase family protein n=1 Tax=Halomonas borealis TaxID=2508710 RepID=UPI00197AB1B6|nr:aldolase/citrate lyase family protein [Halomonas borealis]